MAWGRRLGTAAAGVAIAAGAAGCYGPIIQGERSIQLDCTIYESPPGSPATVTEMRREFQLWSDLPEWTNPGGGTPIKVGGRPAEFLDWEMVMTDFAWSVDAEGLAQDTLSFHWWTDPPAQGVVVTAAPGDEVVLTLSRFDASGTVPGPGPGQETPVSERCVPAPGEDPVVGRIPVR